MRALSHSVAFRVSEIEWRRLGQVAKQQGLSVGGLAKNVVLQLNDDGSQMKGAGKSSTTPTHSVAFRVSATEWRRLGQLARRQGLSVGRLAKAVVLDLIGIA